MQRRAGAHRHALHEADVEADLVPFHGGPTGRTSRIVSRCAQHAVDMQKWRRQSKLSPDDLDEREGDLGVPLLGGLEDEVVEGLADLCARGGPGQR